MSETIPRVSMQQLIDAGLNGFGLQLFIESFAALRDKDPALFVMMGSFSLSFRGMVVTFSPDPDEKLDGSHH